MKPLQFLRALYCVDSRYRQLRGSAAALRGCPTTAAASRRFRAQNPALFSASGLALHFWSRWYAPNVDFEHDPDYAGLPQIPHVQKVLDALQRAYRSSKKLSIYNTEYGYLTDPPNADVGYPGHPFPSPTTAAGWLNWAEYLEWKNPRIQSFAQYVLTDSPSLSPGPYTGWSSGLITYTGQQKPTYGAWRMPLYLPSTSTYSGGSLEVWGCLRPARYAIADTGQGQTAQIQFAPSGSSDYTTVATAGVNDPNNCYFDRRIQFPGSGTVRVQWGNASSSSSSSVQLVNRVHGSVRAAHATGAVQPHGGHHDPLGAPRVRRQANSQASRLADSPYMRSISASYLAEIGRRLSFIVGVSSSPPGAQSPGTTVNFLICSTRARRWLAASMPA